MWFACQTALSVDRVQVYNSRVFRQQSILSRKVERLVEAETIVNLELVVLKSLNNCMSLYSHCAGFLGFERTLHLTVFRALDDLHAPPFYREQFLFSILLAEVPAPRQYTCYPHLSPAQVCRQLLVGQLLFATHFPRF